MFDGEILGGLTFEGGGEDKFVGSPPINQNLIKPHFGEVRKLPKLFYIRHN